MKVQLGSEGKERWYLASIIMVITIEGESKNVVHKNLHLIQAESDDIAYAKAIKLGNDSETSYLNSNDQLVDMSFYGLAELEETIELDIYDGVELTFDEFDDLSISELEGFVPLKKELSVFSLRASVSEKNELDYGSKEVRDMVERSIKGTTNQ
jgi:hypothetical protein